MATMTTTTPPTYTQREPGQRETASPRDLAERGMRTVAPRVDIYEAEKAYVLLADMPGVLPDGLDVVPSTTS